MAPTDAEPLRTGARRLRRLARVARGRVLLAGGVEPVSRSFGFERGKPIHRHYLESFLRDQAHLMRGHCLEFQNPGYCRRFGRDRPTAIDVLDLDAANPEATLVVDLTQPNDLEGGTFDCIVCVHVLHLVYEADVFAAELHRLLAPGGALLVAVPATSMVDPDWTEFRRWTALGVKTLLGRCFDSDRVRVEAYGNSLSAAAEMRGLAADELTSRELAVRDAQFPVEVCAVAVKSDA